MKKVSTAMARATTTVVLGTAALARVRGGLVSNFNRVKLASDYNPDSGYHPDSGNPDVVVNSGPLGVW